MNSVMQTLCLVSLVNKWCWIPTKVYSTVENVNNDKENASLFGVAFACFVFVYKIERTKEKFHYVS